METHRDWVVWELEKLFKQYGPFIQKSSLEIESQIFDKARSPDEYKDLAKRLLGHMQILAKQRALKPPVGRPPIRPDNGLNPFRVTKKPYDRPSSAPPVVASPLAVCTKTAEPLPVPVVVSPSMLEAPPPLSAMALVKAVQPPLTDMVYDIVRIPPPNKQIIVSTIEPEAMVALPGKRKIVVLGPGSSANDTSIVTRLLCSPSTAELSPDTYEASYKFLVPRNSVIKHMTIQLKMLSCSPTE